MNLSLILKASFVEKLKWWKIGSTGLTGLRVVLTDPTDLIELQ